MIHPIISTFGKKSNSVVINWVLDFTVDINILLKIPGAYKKNLDTSRACEESSHVIVDANRPSHYTNAMRKRALNYYASRVL